MRKTTIRKIGKGYEQQFRKEEIEWPKIVIKRSLI